MSSATAQASRRAWQSATATASGRSWSTANSLRDPEGTVHRRYHADHPVLCLVRPDGSIGFLSRPADGDALLGYLDDLFVGAR